MVKTRFPVTIDRPLLFIVWEVDEFAVMITPLILSLIARQMVIGLIIGVILMQLYIKFKRGKHNNYLFHLMWKWGIVTIKDTPPTYIKKFIE